MKLSVIVPALNEQNNILATIQNVDQALTDHEIDGEILLINDGSADETAKIVRQYQSTSTHPIRIIEHAFPMGIGASFWDGVNQSSGDAVVMMPGDNENDPWEIFQYFRLLEHVDIVIPFLFNTETRSLFRRCLSSIYRTIVNATFMVNFNYTNGTVIYRRSMLNQLSYRSGGFFFQTDMLIRSVKRGYLFAEVPYRINIRHTGVSKAVSFPSLMNVIRGYAKLFRDLHLKTLPEMTAKFTEDSSTSRRVPINKRMKQSMNHHISN